MSDKQNSSTFFVCRLWSRVAEWQMVNNIDIGKMIETELKRQGKTVSWLARELGTNRMACYRIFGKQSIDTEVLRRISILLMYDFFEVYSNSVKENIETQ